MRAFAKGKPFMHIGVGYRFTDEEKTWPPETPVFSEAYLYHITSKDNARFIMAVAEEYELLIDIMGQEEIEKVLDEHASRLPYLERNIEQRILGENSDS